MQLVDQCLALVSGITDDKIDRLESALLHMPQADIKTIHQFSPGKYERTVILPPWTVATGARHKVKCKTILKRGRIASSGDVGLITLSAYTEFEANEGTRRAVRVFDVEVEWTDIYDNPDDCRDIDKIEKMIFHDHSFGLMSNRTPEMLCDLRKKNVGSLCLVQ